LLDEHLDWRLARSFNDAHEVRSVRGMGWSGMRNGELLAVAENLFDALITMDQNMQHQQHLLRYDLAVILLTTVSNRLKDTARMVPAIESVLSAGIEPGNLYLVVD
jgi:predicted nuclease of predicted toxin-antitoxin system